MSAAKAKQARAEPLAYGICDSPVGPLLVAGDRDAIWRIRFPEEGGLNEPKPGWNRDDSCFAEAFRQLRAYFAGELINFDLPLRLIGKPFQRQVWKALEEIPYGETISYSRLGGRIGQPKAQRAVGGACGANPLPIVVPCHRVIGANDLLTGFGGGLGTKRFLIAHEQATARIAGTQISLPL